MLKAKYSRTKTISERRKTKIFQSDTDLQRITRLATIHLQKNANAKCRPDEGSRVSSNAGSNQYQASLLVEQVVRPKY